MEAISIFILERKALRLESICPIKANASIHLGTGAYSLLIKPQQFFIFRPVLS